MAVALGLEFGEKSFQNKQKNKMLVWGGIERLGALPPKPRQRVCTLWNPI